MPGPIPDDIYSEDPNMSSMAGPLYAPPPMQPFVGDAGPVAPGYIPPPQAPPPVAFGPPAPPPPTMPTFQAQQPVWSTAQPGATFVGPGTVSVGAQPSLVDRAMAAEADQTYNSPEFKKSLEDNAHREEGRVLLEAQRLGIPGSVKGPPESIAAVTRPDFADLGGGPIPGAVPVTTADGKPVTNPAHTELTVDPERRTELDVANEKSRQGIENQQYAAEDIGKANAGVKEAEAKGAEAVGAEHGKGAEAVTKDSAEQVRIANQWLKTAGDAHQRANELGMTQDPNHYFKSLGTWDRIRLGLASFFGGFAVGMGNSKTNPGLEEIHRGIQEDIANQRMQYESAKGFAGNLDSLWANAYKVTGDKMAATVLANSLATKMVAQNALAMAMRSGSAVEIAKAKDAAARLEQEEGAQMRLAAQDRISTEKRIPAQTVQPQSASSGVPDVDWEAQEKLSKALNEEHVPAAEAALNRAQAHFNNMKEEEASGISPTRYAAGAEGTVSRAFGDKAMNDNLQAVDEVASALAGTDSRGQLNEAKFKLIKQTMRGDGSLAALQNGLSWARGQVLAKRTSVEEGHHPDQVLIHRMLHAQQLATNEAINAYQTGKIGTAAAPPPNPFLGQPLNPEVHGKKAGAGKGGSGKETRPHFEKAREPIKEKR